MYQTLTQNNFRNKVLFGVSFLSLSLFSSIGFSQNAPINFEAGGNGAVWTWTAFENGPSGGPVQIVANPNASGINTSNTVATFTTEVTGQPFAGFESLHGADIGTFTLSASNSIVKIMVYKPVISDVGIKFATSTNGSTGELKVANTLINQWEELTFDFSSKIGETNDQIIFFLDFQTRTTQNTCYFDNVTFSGVTTPTMPTVIAPIPTRIPADVISLFSNAYTNVAVDTWRTPWSNGILTDLLIAGDDVKQYTNLDFIGIETVGPNLIDATNMLFFHIDAWTPNLTAFKVKLVDIGADGAFGGGDDKEQELVFTPTLGGWNSFEIPLSDFTNLTTRAHIAQLILAGNPTGAGNVYIDNVYFHKTPFVNPNIPTIAASAPANLASDVISLFSNTYSNVAVDTWRTPWSNGVLTDLLIAGNDVKQYTNLDFVGIETVGPNLIDATNMLKFHIDAWTPNLTTFRVKLVDIGADAAFGGGDDKEQELSFTPTLLGWNSYDILLSDFTNLTTRAHIAQLILAGNPTGTGNVYIDNVYFHKSPDPNIPAIAAPIPAFSANNVISLYSNTYTNVAVDTWRTPWSNATLTDLQIAGNDTKKYTALDFVGIETVGPNLIDATLMTNFHLDAWTPNMTTFRIKLVDVGADAAFGGGDDKEFEIPFTPLLSGWNSYNIPLSDFTGLTTRAHIAQLILSGLPTAAGTVFIDNVYFRRNAVGINTLKNSLVKIYPNPASNELVIEAKNSVQYLSIINLLGQEVLNLKPLTQKVPLDISELPIGMYTIKTIIDGQNTTSKFIKN